MPTITMTPYTVTINGAEMPVGWSHNPHLPGAPVVMTYAEANGRRVQVAISPDHALFSEARRCWAAERADAAEARAVIQAAERAASPAPAQPEPEPTADAPNQAAPEPAREKKPLDFIGQTIRGKGWRIEFDGGHGKTRVIFARKPERGVIELVGASGFYWSPTLKSWNRGLNWRSYRAALNLAAALKYYPDKPLFAQTVA